MQFHRAIILLMLLGCGFHTQAQEEAPSLRRDYSMGLAMESRFQQDVNPDMGAFKYMGILYGRMRIGHWGGLLEVGREERQESSSGSLRVKSETTLVGVWGSYELFASDRKWSPFASFGLGVNYDKVNTSFQNSESQRGGSRKFAGLGAGVNATFWKHLLLEGEGRMSFVELTKDPVFSLVVRVGAVF